jgi:hypothetical protein
MNDELDPNANSLEIEKRSSKKKFKSATIDPVDESDIKKSLDQNALMMKVIDKATQQDGDKDNAPRLAFVENPVNTNHYSGIYKLKSELLPDIAIKKMRTQVMLVAGILRGRGNTMSLHGHKLKDRFDVGTTIEVKTELKDFIEPEQMVKIQERIDNTMNIVLNCGHIEGMKEDNKMTFGDFLKLQTMNGLSFGRFGTEIIFNQQTKKFAYFRPVDVATIYKTVRKGEAASGIRENSIKALEQITGDRVKLAKDKFENDEYAWVQVIDGTPKQAFLTDEMIVTNLFPSTDIEHNGYPVTPLDTVLSSLTTFISIETYTRLYFQNGRASKGMLVLMSDEVDQNNLDDIKQQFMAGVNNVQNSFRTPLFGIGKDDEIKWVQTESPQKDGEFQFLFDQVTRNILSAFGMSPDELPGFAHLSKGTNNQGLSESSNEWKLQAARDVGIRPLIQQMQDFLNLRLLPIIDPELAQICELRLEGFDAENKQQEATRLTQELPLYYDYDTLMQEVKKESIGAHLGGKIPFNERIRQVMDTYTEVGKIQGQLMESPASYVDPMMKYKRDAMFFQNLQMMAQFNPIALKAFYSTRSDSYKLLKILIQDYLDEMTEE